MSTTKYNCNLCPESFDEDAKREKHGATAHPRSKDALSSRLRGRRSIQRLRKRVGE